MMPRSASRSATACRRSSWSEPAAAGIRPWFESQEASASGVVSVSGPSSRSTLLTKAWTSPIGPVAVSLSAIRISSYRTTESHTPVIITYIAIMTVKEAERERAPQCHVWRQTGPSIRHQARVWRQTGRIDCRARLARGEPAQGGELLGVWSLAGAWDLEDEGHALEPRLVQQGAKALVADLPGADVGVAVAVGAEPGDGVVAVDDVDVLQANDPLELVDGLAHGFGAAFVVARREGMACVEAHADALVLQLRHHRRDLFDARAPASAETRVVLDEQARVLRIRALEHLLQVADDRGQRLLEAGPLVRAGVEDHTVDAPLIRGSQVTGKGAFGALPQRRVVAGEVDQINGVKVEGRMAVLVRRLLEGRDAGLVELR